MVNRFGDTLEAYFLIATNKLAKVKSKKESTVDVANSAVKGVPLVGGIVAAGVEVGVAAFVKNSTQGRAANVASILTRARAAELAEALADEVVKLFSVPIEKLNMVGAREFGNDFGASAYPFIKDGYLEDFLNRSREKKLTLRQKRLVSSIFLINEVIKQWQDEHGNPSAAMKKLKRMKKKKDTMATTTGYECGDKASIRYSSRADTS